MRLYTTLFFILVLLTVAFIFGSQNEQLLTLNYLIARTELTVAAAVSLFTGLGFFLGLLVTILWRIVRKSKKAFAKNKSQEV
ncbi:MULTISPECIES: lipopolysaccharide assembly protein LapA domain-containing protein [Colwellia]|uniref:Lipopolysaccharide assembly protein A n=1 Tax=Colwellia marinimaniae TaxID=1513592 RepID=A0ABQ0MX03_9GAMM|nr:MULTISPECIES: lipopolysaccharide assembly protein LapA domain-containing protein [Colwellia]GAW96772.1 lipopolysaccharide assembly protein A [Colwellia marinimaniae]